MPMTTRGLTHVFPPWALRMKCCSIFSVTLKSAITPSFKGRMATMLPGVRPSMSLASRPTASISPVSLLMATIEGSLTTIPLPIANTRVLAVPRSIAKSEEKTLNKERKFIPDLSPFSLVREKARRACSFDHDVLSDRGDVALAVLRGDRDLVRAGLGKRGGKVAESSVRGDRKHLFVIDDHRRARLRAPHHFHHPAVLNDPGDFQEGFGASIRLLNQVEPVGRARLALDPLGVNRADDPVVGPLVQPVHLRRSLSRDLFVHNEIRQHGGGRDLKMGRDGPRHLGPGKLHRGILGVLAERQGHVGGSHERGWSNHFLPGHAGSVLIESHLFVLPQADAGRTAADFGLALVHRELVLVLRRVIADDRPALLREAGHGVGKRDL